MNSTIVRIDQVRFFIFTKINFQIFFELIQRRLFLFFSSL